MAQVELHIIAGLQALFDRLGWLGVAGVMAFENATGILLRIPMKSSIDSGRMRPVIPTDFVQ